MNYQDKSREELIEELERFRLEKEKRIADLVIANKELVYQNREKENRAAELVFYLDLKHHIKNFCVFARNNFELVHAETLSCKPIKY